MDDNQRHLVVGIDPGRRGAIAWLWGTREHPFERCDLVEMRQPDLAWKYLSCSKEWPEMADRLSGVFWDRQVKRLFIEAPLAPPFDSHKSLVTIGTNFGFLLGYLRWKLLTAVVNPQTWKRAIGIWGPGGKDRAEVVFRALFDFDETLFNPSSIDAALIAVYGMSQFFPKEHWPIPIRKGSCRFVPWPQKERTRSSNGNGRRNETQEGASLEDPARNPRRPAPHSTGPRRQRTPRPAKGIPQQAEAPVTTETQP
jgi:hypothetical protein